MITANIKSVILKSLYMLSMVALDFVIYQIHLLEAFRPRLDLVALFAISKVETPQGKQKHSSLAYPALYALGVLQDAIYMSPFGSHSFVYIAYYHAICAISNRIFGLWNHLILFVCLTFAALLMQWVIHCLFFAKWLSLQGFMVTLISTMVVYFLKATLSKSPDRA